MVLLSLIINVKDKQLHDGEQLYKLAQNLSLCQSYRPPGWFALCVCVCVFGAAVVSKIEIQEMAETAENMAGVLRGYLKLTS